MSEELTKLIDKTVGKKGRLRVPAYWMHKVLSGIVGYVKERVEKLEKHLLTVEEFNYPPMEIILNKYDGVLNFAKPNLRLDLISGGLYTLKATVAAEYTLYGFLNEEAYININNESTELKVSDFGFYKIKIINISTSGSRLLLDIKPITPNGSFILLSHTGESGTQPIVTTLAASQHLYYDGNKLYDKQFDFPNSYQVFNFIIISSSENTPDKFCTGLNTLIGVSLANIMAINVRSFENCTKLRSVKLQEGLLEIRGLAFHNCTSLERINIPDSVAVIESQAFYNCPKLTSINIPKSLRFIPYGAFWACTGLTELDIPNSVEAIGELAFANCKQVISVTIPASVTKIGENAFGGCKGIKSVYITDLAAWCNIDFVSLNSSPFYYDDNISNHYLYLNGEEVRDLVIPESVTEIKQLTFAGCGRLTSATIPDSVTTIGRSAFRYCTGLTNIEIPDSVTEIRTYAFAYCMGLTRISVGKAVTEIGDYVFNNCVSLQIVDCSNSTLVPNVGIVLFNDISNNFKVIVPDALYDDWIVAPGWSGYAGHIVKASEYVETE